MYFVFFAAAGAQEMTLPKFPPWICLETDLDTIENPAAFLLECKAPEIFQGFVESGAIGDSIDPKIGCVSVLAFVQANWVGPPLKEDGGFSDFHREFCLERLATDGEPAYRHTRFPWLLLLAKEIFSQGKSPSWWLPRTLFLQQRILDSAAGSIMEIISKHMSENLDSVALRYGPELLVEASLMAQFYGNQRLSEDLLERAGRACGFHHRLTGILGKRTKFQTFDVSQLTVETQLDSTLPSKQGPKNDAKPAKIELQDEYLLDGPQLKETFGSVSDIGRSILLAEAMHALKFYAKDSAVLEKAAALVQRVVGQNDNWCIYSSGLFLQSQLEAGKSRFIERAALQFEALVSQIHQAVPDLAARISYLFATPLPAEWELDRHQGLLFAGLGAYRTAAVVFERRGMWEEHIRCLIQLGENGTAEEKLMEALQRYPEDSKTLCILGDLHGDPQQYERAWQASNFRYARAQRSLGMHYMQEEKAGEAMVAFQKALSINSLFDKIWFLLGCAAMQMQEWRLALQAFSRTVALDSENSDAWNNLAAAHLHLNQKEEAFKALKEAGKRQFESWKIWHNIFQIALALGEFHEAIGAYRRVAEIRGKDVDMEGLSVILSTLDSAIQTFGREDNFVRAAIRQIDALLDTVMATHLSMNSDFWTGCASYSALVARQMDEVEFHFKAYRAMQTLPVEHDLEAFRRLLGCLSRTRDSIERAGEGGRDLSEQRYQLGAIAEGLRQRTEGSFAGTEEFCSLRDFKKQ